MKNIFYTILMRLFCSKSQFRMYFNGHRHCQQKASPIIVDTSSVQAAGAKLDFSVRPIFPDDDPSTDQHFSTLLAATTPYWQ